jgi:hypothetical protein
VKEPAPGALFVIGGGRSSIRRFAALRRAPGVVKDILHNVTALFSVADHATHEGVQLGLNRRQ